MLCVDAILGLLAWEQEDLDRIQVPDLSPPEPYPKSDPGSGSDLDPAAYASPKAEASPRQTSDQLRGQGGLAGVGREAGGVNPGRSSTSSPAVKSGSSMLGGSSSSSTAAAMHPVSMWQLLGMVTGLWSGGYGNAVWMRCRHAIGSGLKLIWSFLGFRGVLLVVLLPVLAAECADATGSWLVGWCRQLPQCFQGLAHRVWQLPGLTWSRQDR